MCINLTSCIVDYRKPPSPATTKRALQVRTTTHGNRHRVSGAAWTCPCRKEGKRSLRPGLHAGLAMTMSAPTLAPTAPTASRPSLQAATSTRPTAAAPHKPRYSLCELLDFLSSQCTCNRVGKGRVFHKEFAGLCVALSSHPFATPPREILCVKLLNRGRDILWVTAVRFTKTPLYPTLNPEP